MSELVWSIAREAMDKNQWQDKVKAKQTMWRMVKAREDAEQVLEALARYAVDDLIDDLWRRQEVPAHIEREIKPRLVSNTATRFKQTVNTKVREWLLDERIADGHGGNLIVRDATKAQILAYAQNLITHGQSTLKRGHYFRSVGELLNKNTDKVGKVLNETDLERLWTKQGLTLNKTV